MPTWTKVQSVIRNGGSPGSAAFPSNVTAGNLIVVEIGSDATGMTVSDTGAGLTWHQIAEKADGANDQKTALWYAIVNTTGALSVSPNYNGGSFTTLIAQEWSVSDGGTITLDQFASAAPAVGTHSTTATITPTANGALVIAEAYQSSGPFAATKVNSPFTFQDTAQDGFNDAAGIASYQQTTAAAVSATFNFAQSGASSNIIASFLSSGGGGGGSPQTATPTGLASASALGAPTATPGAVTAALSGIASASAFGAVAASPGVVQVTVSALVSAAALGAVTIQPGAVVVDVAALLSDSAFGSPSASGTAGSQSVTLQALTSAAAFGALTALPGALTEPVSGIASASAFGATIIEPGATVIGVTGLDSASSFGALTTDIDVLVAALASAGAFGTPTVSVGPTTIAVGGLGSEAFFGAVSLSGGAAPTFLPSILGGRFRK